MKNTNHSTEFKKLTDAIEAYKKHHNMTDKDFCNKTHIDPGNWNRIKTGKIRPSLKILRRIMFIADLKEAALDYFMKVE